LKTFPGLSTTGAGKVENRARMTRFFARNIPTLLIFIVSRQYDWKTIRSSFDDFSRPRYHRNRRNWKRGPYDSI